MKEDAQKNRVSRTQIEGVVALAVPLAVTYAIEPWVVWYGWHRQTQPRLQG